MKEFLEQIWFNLAANKLRSILTMFGIIWGMFSIVLLSGVSEGLQVGNNAVFAEQGTNIVVVMPGRTSMQAGGIRAGRYIYPDLKDINAFKERSKIFQEFSPELLRTDVEAKSKYNNSVIEISGVWPIYQKMRTVELQKGRLITEQDNKEGRRVAILGYNISKQLFADRDPIGSEIALNGLPYQVIGSMRRKKQEQWYSTRHDDERVIIPFETMRRDLPIEGSTEKPGILSYIILSPHQEVIKKLSKSFNNGDSSIGSERGPLENEIRQIMAPQHNFDPHDTEALAVWNMAVVSLMFTRTIDKMAEFFLSVNIITLLLGGIGVMNIMLISVKERTKEIGIRRALGATSNNILWQFFIESLFLTIPSGFFGFLCAFTLSEIVNTLPLPDRFAGLIITWQTSIFSLLFLVFIGCIAALYPSYRAATMQPIEALRTNT